MSIPSLRMKLLFARHGESEANVHHVIANRVSAHPLTATGRRQAGILADAAQAEGVQSVISSPLQRAIETASIVGSALGVRTDVADALREADCGVYEGRSDGVAWRAHDDIQRRWLEDGRVDARLDGGESLADLRDRFIPFISGLVAADGDRGTTVLLVGHGSLFRCVLPWILSGIDPVAAQRGYLGHTRFVVAVSGPDGRLACLDWPT